MVKKRFVILDGSSLMYRAFYALPLLTAATGEYTNAIYGFSNMLTKLVQDLQPDLLVVAFDKGKKTFRNELFADYKGTRKPTPSELSSQIPLLHDFMEAWGIALVELAGYEADDILGTLSTQAVAHGYEAMIVTGDRDALQLIRPDLQVLLTKRGISELAVFDETAFVQEYGFQPVQLIDLKGLMGDASDNIPGVPGIGKKTASKLLLEFGSVEQVLEHIDEISGKKLQERLTLHRDQALLSKQLAAIDCHVPVDFSEDAYQITPDYAKLREFCQKYGLKSVLRSLDKWLKPQEEVLGFVEAPVYQVIETDAAARNFIKKAGQNGTVSFRCRYQGGFPEVHLEQAVAATGDCAAVFSSGTAGWPVFTAMLADPDIAKTTYNLKEFYYTAEVLAGPVLDVQLAAYLLEPASGTYEISQLAADYLENTSAASFESPQQTAVWEVCQMEKLATVLPEQLHLAGVWSLYEDIEKPLVAVLSAMEMTGVYVNREHLHDKSAEVASIIEQLQQDIYQLAGCTFNINSPKQLGEVLFEQLHLPAAKKTKTGYSTNAEVLEGLRFEHPIIEKILSYRLWTKLKSTYLDSIDGLINPQTQRIHTNFNQMVTATGRLSSSDPNLQNIPVRTEEGRQIRTLFEPGDGYDYLLSADYSQIELRLLADFSQDSNFIEAFRHNQDVHARTASEVFGVPMDEVTPELRRRAKAVNFGIVYGISDYGLSRDLHISRKEAAGYIASYFEKCRGVKAFIDKTVADAHKNGYVTTLFGRRRDLPALHSSNYNQRTLAERMAMNTPIQGSAADIIKLAMIHAYRGLREANLRSRILLQVHDELVLEVPAGEVEQVSAILQDTMEHVVELSVPLNIEIHWGKNWAEAK